MKIKTVGPYFIACFCNRPVLKFSLHSPVRVPSSLLVFLSSNSVALRFRAAAVNALTSAPSNLFTCKCFSRRLLDGRRLRLTADRNCFHQPLRAHRYVLFMSFSHYSTNWPQMVRQWSFKLMTSRIVTNIWYCIYCKHNNIVDWFTKITQNAFLLPKICLLLANASYDGRAVWRRQIFDRKWKCRVLCA